MGCQDFANKTKNHHLISNVNNIYSVIEKTSPKAMIISHLIYESLLDYQITEAVAKINQDSWETFDKNIFYLVEEELSSVGFVLRRGNRLIEGIPGETAMKRRIRTMVWWLLIDRHVVQ